jgi:hypothetical protein
MFFTAYSLVLVIAPICTMMMANEILDAFSVFEVHAPPWVISVYYLPQRW